MLLLSLGSIRLDHHDHLKDGDLDRLANLYWAQGIPANTPNLEKAKGVGLVSKSQKSRAVLV